MYFLNDSDHPSTSSAVSNQVLMTIPEDPQPSTSTEDIRGHTDDITAVPFTYEQYYSTGAIPKRKETRTTHGLVAPVYKQITDIETQQPSIFSPIYPMNVSVKPNPAPR